MASIPYIKSLYNRKSLIISQTNGVFSMFLYLYKILAYIFEQSLVFTVFFVLCKIFCFFRLRKFSFQEIVVVNPGAPIDKKK